LFGQIIAHYNLLRKLCAFWSLRGPKRSGAIAPLGGVVTGNIIIMGATSIHIVPIKPSSERHNKREKELDYVHKEHSHLNESYEVRSVAEMQREIEARYRETVGKKMHSKATPIREGVIVVDENTTMSDLRAFSDHLRGRFGIRVEQIHIHRDEGHIEPKTGELKKNLHAHLVMNWTNEKTGKTLKLGREDMAEVQTIAAECLHMDRGKESTKQGLTAIEYKIAAKEQQLATLSRELGDVKAAAEALLYLDTTVMKHLQGHFTDHAGKQHKPSIIDRMQIYTRGYAIIRNVAAKSGNLVDCYMTYNEAEKKLKLGLEKPAELKAEEMKRRQDDLMKKLNAVTERNIQALREQKNVGKKPGLRL